jgi:hypothetical protein
MVVLEFDAGRDHARTPRPLHGGGVDRHGAIRCRTAFFDHVR